MGKTPIVRVNLQAMFDRLPPHDFEAEMAVLGSLLIEPRRVPAVLAIVRNAEAFWRRAHGVVFDAIVSQFRRRGIVDAALLLGQLRETGQLDDIGGADGMAKLFECVPSAVNAEHYARRVAECRQLRLLIDTAGQVLYSAYEQGAETVNRRVDRVFSAAADGIAAARAMDPTSKSHAIAEAVQGVRKALDQRTVARLPIGLKCIDESHGGIPYPGITLLCGHNNSGKSPLAHHIAVQVAKRGNPVRVFSFEQDRFSVAANMLAAESGAGINDALTFGRGIPEMYAEDFAAAERTLSALPIEFVDEMLSAAEIADWCALFAADGVKLVIVDYLQSLPWPEGSKSDIEAISRACSLLQGAVVRHGLAMVLVSQAVAEAERMPAPITHRQQWGGKRISDIADMSITVFRPAMVGERNSSGDMIEQAGRQKDETQIEFETRLRNVRLHITKHKRGRLGVHPLLFDGRAARFYEDEATPPPPPEPIAADPQHELEYDEPAPF